MHFKMGLRKAERAVTFEGKRFIHNFKPLINSNISIYKIKYEGVID